MDDDSWCDMGLLSTALVVLMTAVLLQILPALFRRKLPVHVKGYTAPGWELVRDAFRKNVESGDEQGGAFAVYHKGELVVNLVGGHADPDARWPWDLDTLTVSFSATKGVTAAVVAVLVDRGLLKYDERIATYWPEFSQNGKDQITVRQYMSHQAGLPALDERMKLTDVIDDPERVSRLLAKQKPQLKPGKHVTYHALTFGLYIDQLVRRVDPEQRDIGTFFREEIAEPLGLDYHIGLPVELSHRCARLQPLSTWQFLTPGQFEWGPFSAMVGMMTSKKSLLRRSLRYPSGTSEMHMNNPAIRSVPFGSATGTGTASALAKFYGILANGGNHDNQRLMSDATILELIKPVVTGPESVMGLPEVTYASGMMIRKSQTGSHMFGTYGHGGQMGFGDVTHKLGWAYLTNHLRASVIGKDSRYKPLEDAVYRTVEQLKMRN